MERNTFLICDKCGGEVLWVAQKNEDVVAASPKEQFAFVSLHIAQCRDGEPPTAQDKAFRTEMRDENGLPVAGAMSGVQVSTS